MHNAHEICWGIRQTKGNDQPFKNTFFGLEGSFPYICLLYWDLMVEILHINLTEVFGPIELVKEVMNLVNRVLVLDYYFI
jgi:hypothetical protein